MSSCAARRLVCLPLLLVVTGCPPSFTEPTVRTFGADVARPNLGDTVHLTWSYNLDEADVQEDTEDRVKSQRLVFQRLHMVGIAEDRIEPNEALPDGRTFDASVRELSLTFNGPIVVRIEAGVDESTEVDGSDFRPVMSGSLTLRLKQDLFCHASLDATDDSHVGYPYLGYEQREGGAFGTHADVEFTQFAVFHDVGIAGRVDLVAQPPVFAPDQAFRQLSLSDLEIQGFRTVEGSLYPALDIDNPSAGQLNAMLFAGAILFQGERIEPAKGHDPDNDARRSVRRIIDGEATPSVLQPSVPVFVAVPMLFGEVNSTFIVSDIQVGSRVHPEEPSIDPPPALVLTATSSPTAFPAGSLGTIQGIQLIPSGTGQLHEGSIKGGLLVHGVRTLLGEDFVSAVALNDLSWRCQFLRDDQLAQVFTLGVQ